MSTKNVAKVVKDMSSISLSAAQASVQTLHEAYLDYKKITEVERTKREAIAAWRDTNSLN